MKWLLFEHQVLYYIRRDNLAVLTVGISSLRKSEYRSCLARTDANDEER